MAGIDDSVRAKFFKKSYEAIDGLWFMKVEEDSDFDRALDIDRRVWEIVPKIQARALRALLDLKDSGPAALATALEYKAELDDADVEIEVTKAGNVRATIKHCPWLELMVKSGRKHLAERVGRAICNTEYPVWQREFGAGATFELKEMICGGAPRCMMEFKP
jgi:hypothetical protein